MLALKFTYLQFLLKKDHLQLSGYFVNIWTQSGILWLRPDDGAWEMHKKSYKSLFCLLRANHWQYNRNLFFYEWHISGASIPEISNRVRLYSIRNVDLKLPLFYVTANPFINFISAPKFTIPFAYCREINSSFPNMILKNFTTCFRKKN